MGKIFLLTLFWLHLLSLTLAASAQVFREDIGELKIHDLLLRPTFTLREPGQGEFTVGESSFALRWELEKKYVGVIRIGPRSLMNPLARFTEDVNEDVTLVEAFGEYSDGYGRIRFGRLPVEFGYEGSLWERYLIFPRSLLFQRRMVMLRDMGISYFVQHNNWYTGVLVSNGESDADADGRIWYTGQWGYAGDKFNIGLVGQTGSTKPTATSESGDTLAGVDPSMQARWRIGGLRANWSTRWIDSVLEFYFGELDQESRTTKYMTGHADLGVNWGRQFSTHLRYDMLDPYVTRDGDLEQHVSLALVLSNPTRSSNLILVGTKVLEEGTPVPNDELRLIWSLSPSGVVRF